MFDTDMCLTRQARSGLTRGSHQKIVYCNFSTKCQWRSHHLTPQKRSNLTVPHMVQESCSSSSEAAGPFLSPPLCWALQGADSAAQVSPRAAAHGYLSPPVSHDLLSPAEQKCQEGYHSGLYQEENRLSQAKGLSLRLLDPGPQSGKRRCTRI